MSSAAFHNGDGDEEEELSGFEAELPSFDISLAATGNEGSGYHTQNDPTNPYQRSNIIERKGAIDVRCSCLDIVHGLFVPDTTSFGTLIVLQFRFDALKHARRIVRADIELRFSGKIPEDPAPEVFAIAPNRRLMLVQTTQQEQVTVGGGVKVGAGSIVTASVKGKWERSVTRDTNDATTVVGSIDLLGRNYGQPNCASWTLLENATTHTGVPASMRVAVLLKRINEKPFQCVVKMNVKADFKSSLIALVGSKPVDDPVLFNPLLDSTNNLRKYEEQGLGQLDLDELYDITFMTIQEDAVKK
jgi:hypothetical protein